MTRAHNNVDVYIGDDLAHTAAQLLDQNPQHRLTVKTRPNGHWVTTAEFTEARLVAGTRQSWAWDALDADGATVRVTAVRRNPGGCTKCGGRR